jgi:hypothetical protein
MRLLARLLLFFALAVFAAGAVAQAAGSARMASEMVAAEPGMSEMPGCVLCDVEDEDFVAGAACDLVCSTGCPVALEVPAASGVPSAASQRHLLPIAQILNGKTTLPDKQPPRAFS